MMKRQIKFRRMYFKYSSQRHINVFDAIMGRASKRRIAQHTWRATRSLKSFNRVSRGDNVSIAARRDYMGSASSTYLGKQSREIASVRYRRATSRMNMEANTLTQNDGW